MFHYIEINGKMQPLKTVFAYRNNPVHAEVMASEAKCKVVGRKLYVLVNTPFKPEKAGVKTMRGEQE